MGRHKFLLIIFLIFIHLNIALEILHNKQLNQNENRQNKNKPNGATFSPSSMQKIPSSLVLSRHQLNNGSQKSSKKFNKTFSQNKTLSKLYKESFNIQKQNKRLQANILQGFLSEIASNKKKKFYVFFNQTVPKKTKCTIVKHQKKHKIKCVRKRISTAHKKIIQLMNEIKNNQKESSKDIKKQEANSRKINKELSKTLKKLHPHTEHLHTVFKTKDHHGKPFQDHGILSKTLSNDTIIPLNLSIKDLSLKEKAKIKHKVETHE